MKIYEGSEDGVIGEFRYQTVEFDQTELVANGGVISQGAAQRYLAKERPDLKIKKCGSFKLDSQANIVTMRFAVPKSVVERPSIPGGSKTLLNDCSCRDQKLLNPGYDELLEKYNALKQAKEELHDSYDRVVEGACKDDKEFHELKTKYDELQHEKDIVGRLYDALVIAVGKDAQKFSDLLVENEELKKELAKEYKLCRCGKCAEMEDADDAANILNIEYDGKIMGDANPNQILHVTGQLDPDTKDAADLGPEGEPELADGPSACDSDNCDRCKDHACNVEGEGDDADGIVG